MQVVNQFTTTLNIGVKYVFGPYKYTNFFVLVPLKFSNVSAIKRAER